MLLCGKLTQKRFMSEARPCMTFKGHTGPCTPDLTGMKIHAYEILERAPDRIGNTKNGRKLTIWKVKDAFGYEKEVYAVSLFRGESTGKISTHGNYSVTPEYRTVHSHYRYIFLEKRSAYVGMPFYDDWNPDKGGSFYAGMQWIINNIGFRPTSKHSLDVIDHGVGFIPGNLRWSLKDTQTRNQKRKTMFLLTIEQHKEALRQMGYGIYKLPKKG